MKNLSESTFESHINLNEQFGAKNYHPLPVVLSRGQGVWVFDVAGKKYLDCLGAYSAMSHGHCHPKLIDALTTQASRLTLSSRAFHNDQIGPYLKKLCQYSDFEQALLMNSGAEAIETALKLARKWGYEKKKIPPNKAEIIVCENNFHGRTLSIVSFSTETQYRDGFGPFTPGFKIIPFNDASALESAVTPYTAAFLVEPIQAEAGILVPKSGYLQQVRSLCSKHQILCMYDEIQTGLSRTGKRYCFEHEKEAKPDVLILGKALGGGLLPLSAVLSSKKIMDVFRPGDHGSTFGGNPLACAIGLKALELFEQEGLTGKSAENGVFLMRELQAIKNGSNTRAAKKIKDIRGLGLLIGVELTPESGPARKYCEALMERGALLKDTHGQVMRIAPPLVIERQELAWLVKQIEEVLS